MFPLLTLAAAAALYKGLCVRRYVLTTGKWGAGQTLRLAVLADLHSIRFGKGQRELLALLTDVQPDYILLPGDIIDDHRPPDAALELMRGAAELAPCYYATGNHEYRTRCLQTVVHMIQECGVTPLLDQVVRLETLAGPLLFAGCEDSERQKYTTRPHPSLRTTFRTVPQSDAYTVLLAHRPEHSRKYARLGFDLVVSGHAHGGQVRIPALTNGVFASGQGLFPRYVGGHYRHGNTSHIVSRGLAVFDGLPRVFNPPEVVVIDIGGTA